MERIKEFSDFHISLFLKSLRFANCSLWSVRARQYWTYILADFTFTSEGQFIWYWILHLFTFQILLIICKVFKKYT